MRLPHSLRSSAARALALTAALALLPQDTTAQGTAPRHAIIPAPNRIELARTGTFTITDSTVGVHCRRRER
jgi:hypothetical protein